MRLADYLDPELVVLDLSPGSRREILSRLVRPVDVPGTPPAGEIVDELLRREEIQSTGVGSGLAIPHGIVEGLDRTLVVVGVCPEGTDFHALDGEPVHLFFLLLSPPDDVRTHVRLLARIARLSRRRERLELARTAADADAVVSALRPRPVPG